MAMAIWMEATWTSSKDGLSHQMTGRLEWNNFPSCMGGENYFAENYFFYWIAHISSPTCYFLFWKNNTNPDLRVLWPEMAEQKIHSSARAFSATEKDLKLFFQSNFFLENNFHITVPIAFLSFPNHNFYHYRIMNTFVLQVSTIACMHSQPLI